MFTGPILAREAVTAPRRVRHYVARATYVTVLLVLMSTAWLVLTGSQEIGTLGDLSRFATFLFQLLSPMQLVLALYVSALCAASSVSREKDRGTLVLLLTTDLRNHELVFGKLAASMLTVIVLLVAALPLFMLMILLGGIQLRQVLGMFFVTLTSALAAGTLGATIALWREKTFQTLAITVLILTTWLGGWEVVAYSIGDVHVAGDSLSAWATVFSPWQALLVATRPMIENSHGWLGPAESLGGYLVFSLGVIVALSALATWRIRRWNPSRALRTGAGPDDAESILDEEPRRADTIRVEDSRQGAEGTPRRAGSREVWHNPVAWREIRTRAYGRRILFVRLAYIVLFGLASAAALSVEQLSLAEGTWTLLPILFVLSLVLINAQAVTALASERDGRTIDLLLATELSPKEIVFGKLGGTLYNTIEMVALPLLLCLALWQTGSISGQNAFYIAAGLLVMDFFVAVLGIHCGLIHHHTRIALATSLGTVFFLFLGVGICMRIMVAFAGSFESQLAPFLAFILGGGIGLYLSLGARNASRAIFWASFLCPFLTFWAITSFIQRQTLGVFLVTTAAYGFATLAMLIPAISEFDVASGRSEKD